VKFMDASKVYKVLLVEDDQEICELAADTLELGGFEVTQASDVRSALKTLAAERFDVLISDLHLPLAGDGLTLVTAMRHLNPDGVRVILTGFPEMDASAAAILGQADEVLLKPGALSGLSAKIKSLLAKEKPPQVAKVSVASILDEETQSTIDNWLSRVKAEPMIFSLELADEERTEHLPRMFCDLSARLRKSLPLGTRALVSPAAIAHGRLRFDQGYTAAMVVEESRVLQVSIFQTLRDNLFRVNFSIILDAVMVIADEVDSQLAQAVSSYLTAAEAAKFHN
jgi:DNA-binding response OmpR family regulator